MIRTDGVNALQPVRQVDLHAAVAGILLLMSAAKVGDRDSWERTLPILAPEMPPEIQMALTQIFFPDD